ncbi:phenylalanine--tRNA ligase subunit beta [Acidiferrimicrobium sp. IK]|uniref:phenylalanine--tRNA ligase subunit beta n=1 Tax=Acidiferrimicrobium sp. IK TaxID=2871700 RepID=UPI0021CB4C4F|nr:phenylalanine--tRNA ligase subunit beta [Acidiferrimicrobium sp. IK]MCU4184776.1 phenylalanine--tRNA ligase subunit beta [Acidiferrimicrobium sp. IK]
MRAPLSWLRDYAPFDAPVEQLTTAFSELGLVVDGVERIGADLRGVEVVRILDIRPHPKADRIRLVDVDRGDGDALQIACGAWNMAVGDLVPLATIGTVLPGGMEIGRRKMMGEWSNGMLCAPGEVGLPEVAGVDGLLILPPGLAPPGTPLAEALDLRPDVVFDLDITANRPDALCMAGIARDLAAALHLPFAYPELDTPAVDGSLPRAAITVEDPDLCPRFTGTVLAGVEVGPSPTWLARRLALAGMRPINNVVDVSNYVMLDVGQPNHAYDFERLAGGGIVVRRAGPGETVTTLDDVERSLDTDDCVICDATSRPVGVAGIMGGAASETTDATTTVLLEAAYFTPMAIARTGTRLKLHSEARYRFERGIDPEIADRAVERFIGLLRESGCPGLRRGATVDVRADDQLPTPPTVLLRTERVNALLGTSLGEDVIAGLLDSIGFATHHAGDGVQSVAVPPWRPDSSREIDVIEEVARLHGYRRIERTVPSGERTAAGLTAYQKQRRAVRAILAGAGLSEAWTTTFLAPGDLERAGLSPHAVEIENPLDRSESILRTSLLPGLLKALRFNADRQEPDLRLFEIGRVFEPPAGDAVVPEEIETLAAVASGAGVDGRVAARIWAVLVDALRLEDLQVVAGEVPGLHPGRSARVVGPDGPLGVLGEVDPDVSAGYGVAGRVAWLSVDLPHLLGLPRRSLQARPVSRYPASDVDLAFVVADTEPAAAVHATVAAAAGELLESVRLFDVYRGVGDDRRSLAFRLRFRSPERTLTDAELATIRSRVIEAVAAAHGGELRA